MADSTPKVSKEEELKIWIKQAIEKQSFYCEQLKDRTWEKYTENKNEIIHLQNKIGFVLFGPPNTVDDLKTDLNEKKEENEPCNTDSDISSSLDESERNQINSYIIDAFSNPLIFEDNVLFERNFDTFLELIYKFDLEFQDEIEKVSKNEADENLSDSDDDNSEKPNSELFPLTGDSTSASTSLEDNEKDFPLFYTDQHQLKQINELINSIRECTEYEENHKDIYVAFIFIIAKIDASIAEFPIIRVRGYTKNKEEKVCFMDCTGRIYKSWKSFLVDNYFPSCFYCYPKNGFYSCDKDGNTELEFSNSPESKLVRKIAKVGDITSGLAGFGCAAVALTSLVIPVAGPLIVASLGAGITTGIWTSGRAVYQLVDRATHNQKLTDQEARGCWINLATGILGTASVGALRYTQYLARNGRVIGQAASIFVTGIEATNLGVSGVNIGHQVYTMYENRRVTAGDLAGLALSVLFFYNAALNMRTAEAMLNESQTETIDNIKSQLSKRQRKKLNRIVRKTEASCKVEKNAIVIKRVMNFKYKSSDPGKININVSKSYHYKNIVKENANAKGTERKFCNIHVLICALIEVLGSLQSVEAKKKYRALMKYYEENLRGKFEERIDKVIEVLVKVMPSLFKEKIAHGKPSRHTFYRKVVEVGTDCSNWNYFKIYFNKVCDSVPDRRSVIELQQKVGCLFILSDHPSVHSVFITAVVMNDDVEKITLVVFRT